MSVVQARLLASGEHTQDRLEAERAYWRGFPECSGPMNRGCTDKEVKELTDRCIRHRLYVASQADEVVIEWQDLEASERG